jgi:serine/threonine protein kinase
MQPSTPPETYVVSRVDRTYDIFGVGFLLFEFLNGPLPYPYDQKAILRRLKKGQLATSSADLVFKPQVPPRLRTIVRKAIQRDPRSRYQTTAEMRAAIAAAPYIAWAQPCDDGETIRWEGSLASRPDLAFEVGASRRPATKRTGKAWLMTGRQRLSAWRRVVDDQVVPSPEGPEAMAFFDHVLSAALNA